jgi:hypothetical protein
VAWLGNELQLNVTRAEAEISPPPSWSPAIPK